jgi:dihydrofolate synthase/folylpolyglutamate synthase
MNYRQTIDWLYSAAPMFQRIGQAAYKEGMENTFLIDEHLGHPHRRYATIHVAGTNGKGSVCHLLASILQEAGFKTGLYTSPHLLDFRERIRVNGQMVEEQFVVDFVARHKEFFETIGPSFFELTTGMAFDYFAAQEVDIAVIETGLGGRLDCTNIITPLLSIITNISFDHVALLGPTLTDIAREKAGIIKPGVPVVIGEAEGEVRQVFEAVQASRSEGEMIFVEDDSPVLSSILMPDGRWLLRTRHIANLIDPLGGYAQPRNAATVLAALEMIHSQSPPSHPQGVVFKDLKLQKVPLWGVVGPGFLHVVENTGLMGRWQIVGRNPKIILDTGHNVGGLQYIVRQLLAESVSGRLHIVFGMVADKDVAATLTLLPPSATYFFTQASLPRALPATDLAAKAAVFGLHGTVYDTVAEALTAATAQAASTDTVFVGGSTFVVADALEFIRKQNGSL